MGDVIAIFDFEGTICTGGRVLWWEIVKSQLKTGHKIPRAVFYILHQVVIGLLFNLRLIDALRLRLSYTSGLARLLKGVGVEDVNRLASQISEQLSAYMRPDMISVIEGHQQQGHRVILVSGAFAPFVEAIGQRLGTFLNIGTELEERDGCYTGSLSGPVCFREERVRMLQERLKESGLTTDQDLSYAYGDRIWDKPILEMTGNPVAVYPDSELRTHARNHGWKIIG